jgi:hypothetical protein
MKKIFQIKITLNDSRPKIWRRVLVRSDLLLSDFHKIIQTTMGWTNSHLHQFIKDGTFYTVRMPDDVFWGEMNNVDYKKIKVSDLLTAENEKIRYQYDYGDNWEHDITLEKILPIDEKKKYPICVAGKMNCPPEDCGGIWGYLNMLKILKKPDHEEYDTYIEWLGEEFDPQDFDKDMVNILLNEEDYGCFIF